MKRQFRCPCCGEFVAATPTAKNWATCPACRGTVMLVENMDLDDPYLNPPPRRRSVAERVRRAVARVTGGGSSS